MELFSSRFDFFPDQRLIEVEWAGPFSLAAAERAISALVLDPRFDPTARRLYDLRRLTGVPQVPLSMRPVLQAISAADPVRARRALVAHEPIASHCRPYMELAPPELSRIFDSPIAARAWLLEEPPARG